MKRWISRWQAQAEFWRAIAAACADSPAVFCYDLMNEPILPGAKKPATEWLTGELAGKFFVQRLTLDLAGRQREEVAAAWIDQMVAAIRRHDEHHLLTTQLPRDVYEPTNDLFHPCLAGGEPLRRG